MLGDGCAFRCADKKYPLKKMETLDFGIGLKSKIFTIIWGRKINNYSTLSVYRLSLYFAVLVVKVNLQNTI